MDNKYDSFQTTYARMSTLFLNIFQQSLKFIAMKTLILVKSDLHVRSYTYKYCVHSPLAFVSMGLTQNNYAHKHVWQQQQFSIFIGPWRYRFRIFLCTQLLALFDNPNCMWYCFVTLNWMWNLYVRISSCEKRNSNPDFQLCIYILSSPESRILFQH